MTISDSLENCGSTQKPQTQLLLTDGSEYWHRHLPVGQCCTSVFLWASIMRKLCPAPPSMPAATSQDLGFVSLFVLLLMFWRVFPTFCKITNISNSMSCVRYAGKLSLFNSQRVLRSFKYLKAIFPPMIHTRLKYRTVVTDKYWWEILFWFLLLWPYIFYDILDCFSDVHC